MDKKEELLHVLNVRENQYLKKILLKGIFFLFEGCYHPLKLFFLPVKDEEGVKSKKLDYGDLLLIEDLTDVEILEEFINSLGEGTEFKISSHKIKPKGYFRDIEEDSNKISQRYGGYSPLSDFERKLLKETRSFPKSRLRQWPTKTHLFKFQIENDCNNLYNKKTWEPLPLKEGLPVTPEYHSAVNWWLDRELAYLSDWTIAFYLPDFSARIKNVKFAKDGFIIDADTGILTVSDVGAKYFIEYENISQETGELDFSKTNKIHTKDKVGRFYIVLYSKRNPSIRIDYRDYNWKHLYETREGFDIEYEEEDIEYWVTGGESEEIEFKLEMESDKDRKEFLETVCSFSNSLGGRIFVGIDNSGNPKGLDEVQIERYQKKIPDLIRNWIEPQVQSKIGVNELRQRKVIMVNINKGSQPPYNYRDHGFYIRAGSTDRIATRDELLSLMAEKSRLVKDFFNRGA
jgi:hypothetical protein